MSARIKPPVHPSGSPEVFDSDGSRGISSLDAVAIPVYKNRPVSKHGLPIMQTSSRTLIAVIGAAFILTSCSVPGVKLVTRPITDSVIVGTLLNPKKVTPETKAHLAEEGLTSVYRKDPAEAVRILSERLATDSSHGQRRALIELCSDTGEKLSEEDAYLAAGYHLKAADLAFEEALDYSPSETELDELVAAYNHSSGQVLRLLFDAGHDWNETAIIEGPGKTYRLKTRTRGDGIVVPEFFDRIKPAKYLKFKKIDMERVTRDGVGAAMVGHRDGTPERRETNPFLPPVGLGLPVNAILDFSRGGSDVELTLHDLTLRSEARLAGRTVPLAADLTAPLIVLYNFNKERNIGLNGLRNPDKYIDNMGLYQLEPYRPDQIPVILVHGLMSSPGTWVSAMNQLCADPALRKRYQLYAIRYPTGFPIAYNAKAVRQRLREFQERFDPGRTNPNMRKMVIVGHSMGGMLSNMQIRSSGDSYTSALFDRPIDDLGELDDVQKEALKDLLIYEPNPDITRAVFVAAPHRGSGIASSPIGNLGTKLIKFPMEVLTVEPLPEIEGLTETGRNIIKNRPTSIATLKPDAPGPKAVLAQPIRKGVTIHSIIGRANPNTPLLESSDQVVPYTSAHLDVAVSEKVVHATHTTITGNPEAVEELRRILYLHAGLPYKAGNGQ